VANGGAWFQQWRSLRSVAAAGLAAGVVLMIGFVTIVRHPSTYVSGATLVFLGSPSVRDVQAQLGEPVDPSTQSPLARDDPTMVGNVFVELYDGTAKQRALAAEGFVGELDVTTVRGMSGFVPIHGPTFSIEVRASSPALAEQGVQLVVADVQSELQAQQAGFDPRLSVTVAEVAPPSAARLAAGSRIRSTVGFIGLALLAALVTAPLVRFVGGGRRSRVAPEGGHIEGSVPDPAAGPRDPVGPHGASVAERSSAAASGS